MSVLDNTEFESDFDERKFVQPAHGWDHVADVEKARGISHTWRKLIQEGRKGREKLTALALQFHALAISPALAVSLMHDIVVPPFDLPELRDIVEHGYGIVIGAPGGESITSGWPDPRFREFDGDPDEDEAYEPRPVGYSAKDNTAKLADLFLAERPFDLIASAGIIYSRTARLWREMAEDELAAEIRATDPTRVLDISKIRRMVDEIRVMTQTTARPFEWIEKPEDAPDPRDAVLFRNGLLNATTGELLPHTGRYFATALPSFDYDPDAVCPTWDRCVGEWLHESFHATLHEFLGYLVTPDTSHHKILAMVGASRGGKSTILRVAESLVGAAHVVQRSLNDLGSDFGLEGCLDAKLLAIPDAHDSHLSKRSVALDRLKTISGGDVVSVNRKNRAIVTGRLPTRIVLSANRHPKFLDESGALAAREIVLVFERSFAGREDRGLEAKLQAELPGIANRALEGLRRLRENGAFTIGERGRKAIADVARSQSPALRFADAHLVATGKAEDRASLDDVFERYETWAALESLGGHERRNRDDFRHDLIAALQARGVRYGRYRWHDPAAPRRQKEEGFERVRGFTGVRLRAE
jgi:P4 family phage/plasmid primase-like protien